MKKQQADKPIDEELLMRMMAGETEKPQGNGDAPETEETEEEAEEPEQETEKRETAVPMENRVTGKMTDGKVQDGKTADGNTDYTIHYCLYADGKETGYAVKLVYISKN